MNRDLTYKKKEQEALLHENCAGKKIVGHSKLKLWKFFLKSCECKFYYMYLYICMVTVYETNYDVPVLMGI